VGVFVRNTANQKGPSGLEGESQSKVPLAYVRIEFRFAAEGHAVLR